MCFGVIRAQEHNHFTGKLNTQTRTEELDGWGQIALYWQSGEGRQHKALRGQRGQ